MSYTAPIGAVTRRWRCRDCGTLVYEETVRPNGYGSGGGRPLCEHVSTLCADAMMVICHCVLPASEMDIAGLRELLVEET